MVPFNDTGRIFSAFEQDISKAILKSAASGFWLMGSETKKFEKNFAQYCGVKYCISLANGTDALEIGLKVLLGEDNCLNNEIEVITVANAGGYSTTACRLLGVKPVYADIDRNTHLIDPQSIIRCLSDKTKVVITTHLYGGIVDVQKIRALLDENGYRHVKILEDCAQAHGGRLNNKRVGAFGDLAAFSFYPTKNLGAMGDAGALVTSNENLYNIASKLKQYGWSKKYEIALKFARNSRMDEIQAAVLNAILPHLDDLNQKRIKIYRRYVEAIRSENIHFLDYSNCDYVAHLAIVIVNEREDFIRFMSDRNISVDIHYPILDIEQPAWVGEDFRMDNTTELNNTKLATGSIVSLPLFPLMNEDEIEAVISAIKVWGRKI
ncbi:DegT/DnrJ/EryC1/StrS family aminotransferase [Vibrio cholerae]|uniref:DegT/DnrJ/EryC1/StrS family aminotransferase n=3 Tax=Vibrio cholerae TaxID=666 RepID=UPI000841C10A|nr:DegT/DnrJ/EryC1/StrS family aminotransferase [Vibrio cholerae]EKF6711874.1 DegT/DnrJ/EryC1/StrS family aminotransferase [Vibrio cholerae]HDZ9289778.1 DegT/DnrJ/EryC1/StrS family aminotransferase [Vibrio cholerae]